MPEIKTVQRFRLFIAVNIPEAIRDPVLEAQAALRQAAAGQAIRWTGREQMHVTLKFLGQVEAERIQALTEAVKAAARRFSPLALRAQGIGFFPPRGRPRVIWASISDQQRQLPLLHRALEEAVQDFTTEEPEAAFSGHLTLGRVKRISSVGAIALAECGAELAPRCFGEWRAEAVEVMRSELSPNGARYTCMAAARLAADFT